MQIIRVAFVLDHVQWQGGVNYFRNLLTAIQECPDINIQPVVVTGLNTSINHFYGLAEIFRTPILDRYTMLWWASKIFMKCFPFRNYPLYIFLSKHKVDLISHSCVLWKNCKIPSVGWIPDFQHRYLPDFFDKNECYARDKQFLDIIKRCDAMILSSQDALNDLNQFYSNNEIASHILRFVPSVSGNTKKTEESSQLSVRYNINQPWFYIPNQFWAHKNHLVVIEALRLAKAQGNNFLVVATGSTNDSRNENYFPSLVKKIEEYNLKDNFRILGMIPFSDVIALMNDSIAVINPSLFEGWSTSVEESKALGKIIILSNITVHQEQAPDRGYFFDPMDPKMLLNMMDKVFNLYNTDDEINHYEKAQSEYLNRRVIFAKKFESICKKVLLESKI